jgi:hypothetical protein
LWDGQVAHEDPDIAKLRSRFVCVRITSLNKVDINRFQFDYDTTWNAFFLDAKLNIYSRYGGRDDGEPEDRISKTSLMQTMREVLAAHADRQSKPGPGLPPIYQPVTGERKIPDDIPLLKKSHQGCVHCHQVREYQFLQWAHDGEFDRSKLFAYPLPEGIGIEFDRKHGHKISKLLKDSAATKAKLQTGDVVVAVDNIPTHSEYDVRWALGKVKKDARSIRLLVQRGDPQKVVEVALQPTGRWRESELGWRKSMRSLPLSRGFSGYPLTKSQRRALGLSPDKLAIKLTRSREKGLALNLGLKKADVILSIAGNDRERWYEEFLSDLVRLYKPGDTVKLTILRDGKRQKLSGKFPKWQTEETSVP